MKIFLLLLFSPLFLFSQTKNKSQAKSPPLDTMVQKGKKKLEEGDTLHACLNFMIAKAKGYYKINHYYGEDEEQYIDDVQTNCYDENRIIKKEIRENTEFKKLNYPPLEFLSAEVINDDIAPILRVEMHNNSKKTVDAFKCVVKCYNRFDEPVKGLSNSNTGIITNQETIESGEDGGNLANYNFYFFDGIAKVKVTLIKVHFKDGGGWEPRSGQSITITATSQM